MLNLISCPVLHQNQKYSVNSSSSLEGLLLLIYLFLFFTVLGLRWFVWAFSSCSEQQPLFLVVCGLQQLQYLSSVVAARGLQSTGSVVCGPWVQLLQGIWNLPGPGSNQCPLHWKADFYPLCTKEGYGLFLKDTSLVDSPQVLQHSHR